MFGVKRTTNTNYFEHLSNSDKNNLASLYDTSNSNCLSLYVHVNIFEYFKNGVKGWGGPRYLPTIWIYVQYVFNAVTEYVSVSLNPMLNRMQFKAFII